MVEQNMLFNICGQRRNDTGLFAAGSRDHSHTQYRRHRPSHLPDDGHRRLCLHAARATAQARHHLVALSHQPHHHHLQLHRLQHQNLQRLLQEEGLKVDEVKRRQSLHQANLPLFPFPILLLCN